MRDEGEVATSRIIEDQRSAEKSDESEEELWEPAS